MKTVIYALVLPALFLQCTAQHNGDTSKPNILIIQPDQHRGDVLSCAGHPDVKTPNLDRLAGEGIRFTHAISGAPVCCPFRATFQTGLYIHEHGVVQNNILLDPDLTTIAEIMVDSGYVTGYIGKWHLNGGIPEDQPGGFVEPGPRRQGWQEWKGYEKAHEFFDVWEYNDEREKIPVEGYDWEPAWQTDVAIDFILRHSEAGQPWCYYLAYGPPHNPEQCPPRYLDMYPPEEISLPPDIEQNPDQSFRQAVRKLRQIYYGQVTAVDHEVGRLMAWLEKQKIEGNTIVFYVSDHGDVLGSHFEELRSLDSVQRDPTFRNTRTKAKPYITAMRIPLIIRWPDRIAPRQINAKLINAIDLAPTLLDLAGLGAPKQMSGTSMADWCISGQGPEQEVLYLGLKSNANAWRGVWDGRYLFSTLDYKVLYDHGTDPYEMHNLYGDPQYADQQESMEKLLLDMAKETGDPIEASITTVLRGD